VEKALLSLVFPNETVDQARRLCDFVFHLCKCSREFSRETSFYPVLTISAKDGSKMVYPVYSEPVTFLSTSPTKIKGNLEFIAFIAAFDVRSWICIIIFYLWFFMFIHWLSMLSLLFPVRSLQRSQSRQQDSEYYMEALLSGWMLLLEQGIDLKVG